LLLGLVAIVEVAREVDGIGDGDNGVEAVFLLDSGVEEEGLGDGGGVGEAGGFEEDVVVIFFLLVEFVQDAQEVAADGAADTAVAEDLLLRADDDGVVDAGLAEFVFDDGDTLAGELDEEVVEEGGLARAEEAGEDGHGRGRGSRCAGVGRGEGNGRGGCVVLGHAGNVSGGGGVRQDKMPKGMEGFWMGPAKTACGDDDAWLLMNVSFFAPRASGALCRDSSVVEQRIRNAIWCILIRHIENHQATIFRELFQK
jgi:hypothetical protein